jgi:hypothetical protein
LSSIVFGVGGLLDQAVVTAFGLLHLLTEGFITPVTVIEGVGWARGGIHL